MRTQTTQIGEQLDPQPFEVGVSSVAVILQEPGLLEIETVEGVWIAEFAHDRSPPFDIKVRGMDVQVLQIGPTRWRLAFPPRMTARQLTLEWHSIMPRPVLVSVRPATPKDGATRVTELDTYRAEYRSEFEVQPTTALPLCRRALFRLDLAANMSVLLIGDNVLLEETCAELHLEREWYEFSICDFAALQEALALRYGERAARAVHPGRQLPELGSEAERAAKGVLRIIQGLFDHEIQDPAGPTWSAIWTMCLEFANGTYRRPVEGPYFNLEPNGFAFSQFAEFASIARELCDPGWKVFWREFERTFVAAIEVLMDVYHRPGAPRTEDAYEGNFDSSRRWTPDDLVRLVERYSNLSDRHLDRLWERSLFHALRDGEWMRDRLDEP